MEMLNLELKKRGVGGNVSTASMFLSHIWSGLSEVHFMLKHFTE